MVNWIVGKEYKTRDGKTVVYVGPVKDPVYGDCTAFYGKLAGCYSLMRRKANGCCFSSREEAYDVIDPSVMTGEEFSAVVDILKQLGFGATSSRMLSERDYTPEYVHKIVETLRKFKNG